MSYPTILTIDLNFQNKPGTIGTYLIPYSGGGILVESGPASTIPELIYGLSQHGLSPADISDVFLTHIHLDHAGAAGWFAQHGARIHVHPNGANHLINPEKLLASAARIYGSHMDTLWGEFYSVPENQINILNDTAQVVLGNITIQALDVPGHANHHLAYLVDGACFSGDVGGIRVHNQKFISLPMPPPDLNLELWRASIRRLIDHHPNQIIPTHFGVYPDAEWHLNAVLEFLDIVESWIEETMVLALSPEEIRNAFIQFESMRAQQAGLQDVSIDAQQTANPSVMSADGIYRYWNKYRRS